MDRLKLEPSLHKIIETIARHVFAQYKTGDVHRLPVVAMYSMYSLLVTDAEWYSDKKLAPLASHTIAALGDIEIIDKASNCFEAVKIKHLKPITISTVNDVYRKIKNKQVRRYYILTTHDPICSDSKQVFAKTETIHKMCGCEVIVNGVLPSLKYYLRLVSDPNKFVAVYTSCLQAEFQRGSGIKQEHLEYWLELQRTHLNAPH